MNSCVMMFNSRILTRLYTAYIWSEGRNITVFYYNTTGLAAAGGGD